ncbi:Ctr copper transporter [Cryomyces antarcticus]
MDHDHMDHGDMGGGEPMCSMNMLFTWDTNNLCIVFKSWRIRSTTSLLFSLLAIVALTAGYELVRETSRQYEERCRKRSDSMTNDGEASSLLWAGRQTSVVEKKSKMIKAALYAVQVFYSFFIMLLFMTYNGWVMLAVAAGAFVGYLMFSDSTATKSAACH